MGEVGCLKDGCFQNLRVEGQNILVGQTTVEGHLRSSKLLQPHAVANVAPTLISNALVLAVNTFYNSIAGACAMTLPSAAAGNIGDFISVFYVDAITAGVEHSYTIEAADTNFALGSTAQRVGGAAPSTAAISVADDEILAITGHATGDGGCGTSVKFVNMTGATDGWAVEAITYNQGAGNTAATIAFS